MDGVKLMDRTDTKYTFHLSTLTAALDKVIDQYKVLEVEGKRASRYKTLYYDTNTLELYTKHHNGELNRYKIRHRTYVESDIGFLEVKFKNNKGRTLKERIKKKEVPHDSWDSDSSKFLGEKLPFDFNTLEPVLWVNYSRITLVNRFSAERLTIDLDLEFLNKSNEKQMANLVIAEVKQESRKPSPFIDAMKELHIREGSISKYCMGIALTRKGIKKNSFKAKLLSLKHIVENDLITSAF